MNGLGLGGNIDDRDELADCCCSTMSKMFRRYGDD